MQIISQSSFKKSINTRGFKEKELIKIEEFLGIIQIEIDNPVPLLAKEVLLASFGYPLPESKKNSPFSHSCT